MHKKDLMKNTKNARKHARKVIKHATKNASTLKNHAGVSRDHSAPPSVYLIGLAALCTAAAVVVVVQSESNKRAFKKQMRALKRQTNRIVTDAKELAVLKFHEVQNNVENTVEPVIDPAIDKGEQKTVGTVRAARKNAAKKPDDS